jgi:CheY-like chemotaxis protein
MSANPTPELRKPKLLFLDDDSDLRRVVGLYLRTRGYDVTLAEDLEEAGALLCCRRFDVLCADLSLDSLGRFEALDLIAEARTSDRSLSIVVQTGTDDADVHAACRVRGADAVVVKRETPEPLLRAIESVRRGEVTCAVA